MRFGNIETFAELLENMQLNLSGYQPSRYTFTKEQEKEKQKNKQKNAKQEKDPVLTDEVQREFFW